MLRQPDTSQPGLRSDMIDIIHWARLIRSNGVNGMRGSLDADSVRYPFINYGLNMVLSEYRPDDVRAMKLSDAKAIYRAKYWDALRCDELPAGVDDSMFDYGVNSGIARAGKVLRRVLGPAQRGEADQILGEGDLRVERGIDRGEDPIGRRLRRHQTAPSKPSSALTKFWPSSSDR